ncbi:MAG: hypothetical protein M3069_01390 [Chloroflexota bacterium]|nr:hypothetical protein [Chloroflexota bacterium]
MAFIVSGLLAASAPAASQAAQTLVVCPSGCPYSTIHDAVTAASAGDTIDVKPGTYRENLTIDKPLTITGAGAQQTIVASAHPRETVVVVAAHPVRLAKLTVEGSEAGGIFNQSGGTLTVAYSTVRNNPRSGGGIGNDAGATLILTHSTVSGNAAGRGGSGGGLSNAGTAIVRYSQLLNNFATTNGGGIVNTGEMTLTYSTVSGNSSHFGGGIYNNGKLTMTHSTVSSNTSTSGRGGGILNDGTATLKFSQLLNNSAGSTGQGGAIYSTNTQVKLVETEVRGNSTPQCVPTTICVSSAAVAADYTQDDNAGYD